MGLQSDLRGAIGPRVLIGSRASTELATTEFPGHAGRRPSALVRPVSFRQVARVLQVMSAHDEPMTVIGGSHSPRGVADGVVCLDLRGIPSNATLSGSTITANGACLVRDVLAADPAGQLIVPVGVADTLGMGLLTTGGVGGLTRSLGLSIDSIQSVTLLLANGAELVVDAGSGEDLWWAVRGAASRLGVISSVSFRAHHLAQVTETHLLTRASALRAWAQTAPTLPRQASLSWIATRATDGSDPLLLLVEVTAADTPNGAATQVGIKSEAGVLRERTWQHPYREFAPWLMPQQPAYSPPQIEESERLRTLSLWCSAAGVAGIVDDLVDLVRRAPNYWCRLECQHAGGAMGEVPDERTAFYGRAAEYNLVATAMWTGTGHRRIVALRWLRHFEKLAASAMIARYASDIVRGERDHESKLQQIYGPKLPKLRAVAQRIDPAHRFRYAPPF